MSLKSFEADLKNDNLKQVCLLYGSEGYLVKWAAEALVRRFVNEACADFDLTKFDGRLDPEVSALLNACETLPVLSGRKVVLVDSFKSFESTPGLDEKEEKKLIEYIQKLPESCLLIFSCGEKVDKRKRIYKKISEAGHVYEFGKLTESDLTKWISKQCKARGKQITPKLTAQLIEITGYYDKDSTYGLSNMENDIRKAAAHAAGESIEPEDIVQTVSGHVQRDVFAMIDALSRQDKKYALEMLAHLLDAGEAVYGALALLFRQYEHLLKISEMKENGAAMPEIRRQLGLQDFIIRKLAGYADRYGSLRLKKILREIYQVDKHIKTGFLDPRLAMELFIAMV